eukprot:scaffold46147_cov53-Attheya_sp.AAC.4
MAGKKLLRCPKARQATSVIESRLNKIPAEARGVSKRAGQARQWKTPIECFNMINATKTTTQTIKAIGLQYSQDWSICWTGVHALCDARHGDIFFFRMAQTDGLWHCAMGNRSMI